MDYPPEIVGVIRSKRSGAVHFATDLTMGFVYCDHHLYNKWEAFLFKDFDIEDISLICFHCRRKLEAWHNPPPPPEPKKLGRPRRVKQQSTTQLGLI